ncbi:DMP19 family protein [Flavobacterium sp. SM2513]|uniref:DMP19 family protein n=1 Tax=Flavobacterium sp. SM2513 TaxID=3424766 RepID=UPI003D7F738B
MKTVIILIIVILILVVGFLVWRKKSNNITKAPTEFVKPESTTESTKHLPLLSDDWISEIEKKWAEKEWGIYDNGHYDISEQICNEIYSTNKYWEKNQTHADFLNELTKEQRIYFTLINFESQVNNGGVYQFLFNYPELAIIALQGMKETGMVKLANDYETVLNEYFGKFKIIHELYARFQNNNNDWNKRWNSFAEGYKELPSAEIIENYFYEESFVKTYHEKLIEYVKANPKKLYRTE